MLNFFKFSLKKKQKDESKLEKDSTREFVAFLNRQLLYLNTENPLKQYSDAFLKKDNTAKQEQLPQLYLRYEQQITGWNNLDKVTTQELRSKIRDAFPKLVESPALKLIFDREINQEISLCSRFLIDLLDQALRVLGQAKDKFFDQSKQWIEQLPKPEGPYPFLPIADFETADFIEYLKRVSFCICEALNRQMGANFTEACYNKSYNNIASSYKQLDVFPTIIRLIPRKYLDEDKVGLLSKHQLTNALLEKVVDLERLNKQLEQMNLDLIDARTNLEIANAKSEHSLRLLQEIMKTVKEGIITSDASGQIIMVNEEVERIWGYSIEELKQMNIVELMPNRYKMRHKEGMKRYIKTGVSHSMNKLLSMEGLKKDGTEFCLEINISDLQFEGQHLFTAVVRDITERKAFEEALRTSKRQLEHRTYELEGAQAKMNIIIDELRESNQELERFAYIASHDLQEPLRTVSSYVQIIGRELNGEEYAYLQEYISFAVGGVHRMRSLIEDLLLYSRVGRKAYRPSEVELGEIVEFISLDLAEIIKITGAQIVLQRSSSLIADRSQIRQLLQNLISNSIKFRQEGLPPKVFIDCSETEDFWQVKIQDNGIGIAPQAVETIFIIFHRLHPRHEYPGTGIGLAICKKIIDRHGGKIWVESIPGEGSTFYFTIPKKLTPLVQLREEIRPASQQLLR